MDKNMDRALLPINCTILEWVTKMCFCGESVCCFALNEEIDAAAKVCCSVKFADHMHPKPVHFFMFPVWLTF
jgi:hypothetical protein